jgi:hypothetical protein
VSGAGEGQKERWTYSFRAIPGAVPRAQLRNTLTYSPAPQLRVGLEVNPRSQKEKVNPLVNWLPITEGARRPSVMFGTSSDRIGTPTGQSFYMTVAKDLHHATGVPIAPYVGTAYSTYQDRFLFIGGLNVNFTRQISTLTMFDGVHVHPTVNWTWRRHVFSLVLVRGREPGVSYSVSF